MTPEQMLLELGIGLDVTSVTCARKIAKDGKVYFVDVDGVHTFTEATIKKNIVAGTIVVAKEGGNFKFTWEAPARLVKVDADSYSGWATSGSAKVSDIQFA